MTEKRPGFARRLLAAQLVSWGDRANRRRDWERAERIYGWALALRPRLPGVLVQYGHALKERGFPHQAAAAYRKAAGLAGHDADPWAQLGHALVILDKPREAAAAFAAALALAPDTPGLREDHDRAQAAGATPAPHAWLEPLLEAHDLPPRVVSLIVATPGVTGAVGRVGAELWAAVDAFGRSGIGRLEPLDPRLAFDAGFYRAAYPVTARLGPVSAYRHWLSLGTRMGWAPNKAEWLHRRVDAAVGRLGRDARSFADAALAIEAARPQLAAPFGWLESRTRPALPRVAATDEAAALSAFAYGLGMAGLREDALRLRAAASRLEPDRSAGMAARGDRSAWRGVDYWDDADMRIATGDWEGALALLAEAARRWPADAGLLQHLEEVADRAIHAGWAEAERLAAGGGSLDAARAALAATIRAAVAALPTPTPVPPRPVTAVAIVGNGALPQCRFYRIDQKLEQLADAGYAATFFEESTDIPRFLAAMLRFQMVVFYRAPAHLQVIKAILGARAAGLLTVYEIDDLLFDGEHYPAPIETYGGELGPAEHRGLALGVPMYAEAMALCDYGLASTEALAEAMRPLVRTREVFVHPNSLGRAHLAFASLTPTTRIAGRVKILYGSHTKAHKADVQALVEPALAALVARHGAAMSILMIGFVPLTPALEAMGAQVTILDPMPLADYWALLATADIVVAPLFRTPATDAKSEIKWLEAAMLGVPAVVSWTDTAERVIDHGRTGFLCATAADWTAALDRLVADPALRRAVGAAAKAEALRRYGPAEAAAALAGIVARLSPPARAPKLRVLIVNVFYPPQTFGGATRVVRDNVEDLRARHGHAFDIEVFASLAGAGEPGRVRTVAEAGGRVTTVSASPGLGGDEMQAKDAAMEGVFADVLDAVAPDLVHFHCVQRLTASVVEATRRRGIPYVITAHDAWWISSNHFLLNDRAEPEPYDYRDPLATLQRYGRPAFERLLALAPALMGAKAVLAVSAAFAAVYAASGVPNVVAVPNGVSAMPPAAREPNTAGPIRLGFLGGLQLHKGWGLIEAALRGDHGLTPFSLLAVDNAMAATDLRREQWGDMPVEYRGPVPAAAVGALYGAIDVLLAPSLWPESFGLVAREALHYGCWVIVSDRGGMAEVVADDVNGFVIDVTDEVGLRQALARIAADPNRFRRPPPATPLRTAQEQADDLARIYTAILEPAPT